MMLHTESESDVTTLTPRTSSSSPTTPTKQHHHPIPPPPPVYFVQSPSSRDYSHDDKSSSSSSILQPTTPMDYSPSHSTTSHRASSASRVSGNWRRSSRKRSSRDKGWRHCNVIDEEEGGDDDDDDNDDGFVRRSRCLVGVMGFVVVFSLFCLIIWGASRPYGARVSVKSLTVNNFYVGEGSDLTGVPTKLLTLNCSVKFMVYNPTTFFGIHVSSDPVILMYSELTVATGQLKKYYQPRKSERNVAVSLEGYRVHLYGAGASLAASDCNIGVPLKLDFVIQSRGNVVGKLVKTKHHRHVSCSLVINSKNSKAVKFKENSCTYE